MTVRELPVQTPRVETGPVQFGNDWPGLFIRGDQAFGYAMYIDQLLIAPADEFDEALAKVNLRSLAELLRSCDARKS